MLIVVGPGTRHTLASYVSMHTVPAVTASSAHFLSGFAPCAPAVPPSTPSPADTVAIRNARLMARLLISLDANRTAAPLPGVRQRPPPRGVPRQRVWVSIDTAGGCVTTHDADAGEACA